MERPLTQEEQADIDRNKDVAAMSYLSILSVVVRYARRDSPFIAYHAKQGIWLFLISIPVWLIPGIGHYLEFFVLAGMIIGFLNAAQGQKREVPIVGRLASGALTLRDIWKSIVRAIVRAAGVFRRGVMGPKREWKAPEKAEGERKE